MSIISPNMNLVISTIGTDSGLQWETNLNSALNRIDQHNHTPGYGVQITPAGLNINSALTFNNQQATNMQAAVFSPQSSLSTLNAVYVQGADLYYNDSAGNIIRITSGGSVNATSSGISSGTNTASFVSNVLVVNAASSTPADIQAASILLGNNSSGSKYLTLSPPSAMASNITQTLPTIPASATSIMQMDTSGNMSAALNVDGSTLIIATNVLEVASAGITSTQMASNSVATAAIQSGAVTGAKIGMAGAQVSASCGNVTTWTNSSYTTVTNLSVTITTTGRPVLLMLNGDTSTSGQPGNISGQGNNLDLAFFNGSTVVSRLGLGQTNASISYLTDQHPASAFNCIDTTVAGNPGTYTYTFQVKIGGGSQITVSDCVLVALEI